MSADALEEGYWRAYQDFYRWGSIFRGAWTQEGWAGKLRHVAYAGGWKKFEAAWGWVIRAKRASNLLPILETVLAGLGRHPPEDQAGAPQRSRIDAPKVRPLVLARREDL